jgi:hypothetical protein
MTKFSAEDFTTCEMCGKDSADGRGYCAECDYTTGKATLCPFCNKAMTEEGSVNNCFPCSYWENVTL